MIHLKGTRFGFPLIQRLGVLKHLGTYPVSWNRHAGLELHYVIKGDISWEISGSESPLAITGGSFGIIPPGTDHRAFNDKGTPAIRLGTIFEKSVSKYAAGTPFSPDDLKRIFYRFKENAGNVRRFSKRLSAIVRDFADAMMVADVKDPDEQLRLRTLSSQLLYETYVTLGEPEALAEGYDVIPKICQWIDEHCSETVSMDRLVKLSGYGRSRFFELFLADTGMSPNDYLVRARIELAKRKLTEKPKDVSMLELAVSCGFNSASVFSSVFRKYVGMSPRDFRKTYW